MTEPFHPDLRLAALLTPRLDLSPRLVPVVRRLMRAVARARPRRDVEVRDVRVPGPLGAPDVRVRCYRPRELKAPAPALLWMHGGGYMLGVPEMDDASCAATALELGIVIVSVDYRLAPENPFPAALEDCYAALRWLSDEATALGVRAERIAIGGASAGGGLTAALAQLAHDRGGPRPAFQLLIYPMLDDRTALRADIDGAQHRAWSQRSNWLGWSCYLGRPPGDRHVPEHAVPARRSDLSGLPPAWLGVGTCDLFHDEDLAYARRLNESSVPCELVVAPGAFHGFDVIAPRAGVSRDFRARYRAALRSALFG
jgi:acetyl esterase/lipase